MPPSSPLGSPYEPPRAGKLWVGRRARVAVQAERTSATVFGFVRWCVVAAIPGLPFWARGWRILGLVFLGAWAISLARFLSLHQAGPLNTVRAYIPGFGAIQFETVHIWFGLAAGIHIASVAEQFRPMLQSRLREIELPSRIILTLAATLFIASFVYYCLYAPLL